MTIHEQIKCKCRPNPEGENNSRIDRRRTRHACQEDIPQPRKGCHNIQENTKSKLSPLCYVLESTTRESNII